MPGFKEKADFNLQAGKFLKDNHHLYDPSIHCFYYSCIQDFLHIIYNKLNISKQQFNSDKRNARDGTHGWAYKLIHLELGKLDDKEDFKWVQRAFPELKLLRENADYVENISGIDESNEALTIAETMKNVLRKRFK